MRASIMLRLNGGPHRAEGKQNAEARGGVAAGAGQVKSCAAGGGRSGRRVDREVRQKGGAERNGGTATAGVSGGVGRDGRRVYVRARRWRRVGVG